MTFEPRLVRANVDPLRQSNCFGVAQHRSLLRPFTLAGFCSPADLVGEPPPSFEILICSPEAAIPLPVLAVPFWKTRAHVVRTRSVPFAPPEESGRVVL